MKKILAPVVISLLVLSPFAFSRVQASSVNAYEKNYKATLPTEIDLNDCDETTIRNYYADLNDKVESERQGTNLLKNLKPILKKNQQCYSYGASATTEVWQSYEIIDRDWTKSPASEIEGYNASTNKISGYKYGKSNSDVGSNPYLHALYVNRNAENGTKAWGDHGGSGYGHNQEHVWPKSAGFEDEAYPEGSRGDLMHLWAGNGDVNQHYHNNWYYGYVDKTKDYKDAGTKTPYLSGNLLGLSKTFGGTTSVFEPQDSDKGDIARTIFYMAARYNFYSGSDSDGINSSNPNLEIVNDITSFVKTGYTSNETTTGKMGILQDLLEWNKLDPVDEFEIHRNNLLYRNFSFNRNPFIDFPEWADYIWGTCTNGVYNSTPTGAANPKGDGIPEPSEPVPPTPEPEKGGLNTTTIIIIIVAAVVVVVILIIIFVSLSKKNKKKVLKTVKKTVKKSSKKKK